MDVFNISLNKYKDVRNEFMSMSKTVPLEDRLLIVREKLNPTIVSKALNTIYDSKLFLKEGNIVDTNLLGKHIDTTLVDMVLYHVTVGYYLQRNRPDDLDKKIRAYRDGYVKQYRIEEEQREALKV